MACGNLVEGRDPGRFAERCLTLMRDNRLRRLMGDDASAAARSRLSTEAIAQAYRRLYDECRIRVGR